MNPIPILLLLTFNKVLATDYCSEAMKCNEIANSGCDCAFGPDCHAPKEHRINNDIRNSLLVAHNKYREKIASGDEIRGGIKEGATKMYALQYDIDLEHTATCWNKKCTFAHDQCRVTEDFRPAGQNLYWSSGKGCSWDFNLNQATELWYEEIKDMTESCFKAYGSGCDTSKVGHFTQMIWAETTHVGCSLVEYAGPSCQVACNYGPAGNFLKEKIYKTGSPASECNHKSKQYKHLCLLSRDQEYDYSMERDIGDMEDTKGTKDTKDAAMPGELPPKIEREMAIIRSSADAISTNQKNFFMLAAMICFIRL